MLLELANTKWAGQAELWIDPLGNHADLSDCTIEIAKDAIEYRWSYEGKPQTGRIALKPGGADFTDTWHSPTPIACVASANPWGLVDVLGRYSAGDGPEWGWRISLAQRPGAELLLQMTNIAPWGEEGRAVRMICKRA